MQEAQATFLGDLDDGLLCRVIAALVALEAENALFQSAKRVVATLSLVNKRFAGLLHQPSCAWERVLACADLIRQVQQLRQGDVGC